MTRKERVLKAIQHEETDIVPYQLNFTIPARKKVIEYAGDENFLARIGNHLAMVEGKDFGVWRDTDYWQDEFGVIWNRKIDKDIGTVEGFVLPEPNLKSYCFPDPYRSGRFEHFPEFISQNHDRFILFNLGFSLFERAWTLRGMENFLVDMLAHPVFVEELLDAILEYNLGVIDQALNFEIDGCLFGDDWGQQNGLIMGPHLWRRFIKPRVAKMYAKVRERGKKVFIHSCGDVDELFPDLIEIGLDVFNPFQPEVMDVFAIKRQYGKYLSFYGGISVQRLLPLGTPEEVKQVTRRMMEEIAKGGGYIIAPAHDIPGDVPAENILALLEVVQNQ